MKLIKKLFKILIYCKFELIAPSKSDVVIWGAPSFIKILKEKKYIPSAKKINIIYVWGESLNLFILLKCFLKLNFNFLDYTNEYIRTVKPKIIISFLDNYELFYKLKTEKNQKKILIQNAWRSDENKFFEKRYLINFYVDYILTHNFSIKKKYQNISKSLVYPTGSFLSNNSSIKNKSKKYDLLFISTFRNNKENVIINDKISLNDYIKAEAILVKHIFEYCKLNKKTLFILPTPKKNQEFAEKQFFKNLFEQEENWKFLKRKNNDFDYPYNTVDQSEIVVGIDSTLLYESFARGTKTIFFDIRPKNSYLAKKRHFAWPKKYKKDGPFWTSSNEPKKIHQIIKNVSLINSKDWKKIINKYKKNLMVTDDKNSFLKKIIKKYLK